MPFALFLVTFFRQFQQFPNTPIGEVERLMAFNQFWDAYQRCKNIIAENGKSTDPKVYRLMAHSALSMTMSNEAKEAATNVIKNRKAPIDEKRTCFNLRARANLQLGNFKEAEEDARDSKDRQIINTASQCAKLNIEFNRKFDRKMFHEAAGILDQLLGVATNNDELKLKRADIAWILKDTEKFHELAKDLVKKYTNDSILKYRYGLVLICKGSLDQGKNTLIDIKGLKGAPSNTTNAINDISDISRHYRSARNNVNRGKYAQAETELAHLFTKGSEYCPESSQLILAFNKIKLDILHKRGDDNETFEFLNILVDKYPDAVEFILERADRNLENEDYDAAIYDYQTAQRKGGDRRAAEGIRKAQAAKRAATTVDYYKILNISRSATQTQIKDAFRRAVRRWHPDQFVEEEDKKNAEDKMRTINIAYDILSDPQKRNLYDQGVDPENPGASGGGMSFYPFEMFFGGGGPFGGFGGLGGGQRVEFGNGNGFHFEFHF